LARPIRGSSWVGHPGLGFPWCHCPRWSDRTVRRSNHQPLCNPSLGLHRGTPINMYQGYAIQSPNIQWHTSLQQRGWPTHSGRLPSTNSKLPRASRPVVLYGAITGTACSSAATAEAQPLKPLHLSRAVKEELPIGSQKVYHPSVVEGNAPSDSSARPGGCG
jgi:hypothetical protein